MRGGGPSGRFRDAAPTSSGIRVVRIVGGKYAGRDLMSPADKRVRPTAEAVNSESETMVCLNIDWFQI